MGAPLCRRDMRNSLDSMGRYCWNVTKGVPCSEYLFRSGVVLFAHCAVHCAMRGLLLLPILHRLLQFQYMSLAHTPRWLANPPCPSDASVRTVD